MSRIDRLWYSQRRPLRLLAPLAVLFGWIARRRRRNYLSGKTAAHRPALPVLVVGNITVGGTGKSPFTAWLIAWLQKEGWRPVILSRGYGGTADHYPHLVTGASDTAASGDEPVMLAQQTHCYVVVDPRRARAAAYVEEHALGDILVCDDGLQHYALARDVEFALFDGSRGAGNTELLPVGPLRESLDRLNDVDFCVSTGDPVHPSWQAIRPMVSKVHQVRHEPVRLRNLHTEEMMPLTWLSGRTVNGVAGIANPSRFFDTLFALGAKVIPHPFSDHHCFTAKDLALEHGPVVMTAKDAVKCKAIPRDDIWVLDVIAQPDDEMPALLQTRLKEIVAELP